MTRGPVSTRRSRNLRWAALTALVVAIALFLTSRPGRTDDPKPPKITDGATGPLLHEYIPESDGPKYAGVKEGDAGEGKLPVVFHDGSSPIPRPRDGRRAQPGERPISVSNPGSRRDRATRPDRDTRHDGTLHYQAVFNPSVVPFKRTSAQGAVDKQFVLRISDATERPVALTPLRPSPDRSLFWGSLLISGKRLPLPSVSPDMAIHGYETEPQGISVSFYRDGDGNFSVEAKNARRFRLRFLVSASNRYFHQKVGKSLSLRDIPATRRTRVPAGVARIAARMQRKIGVSRGQRLHVIVDRLVEWFRAFEEGPLAVDSGNTYADLTVSQRGVCRHRSYAFVITALSLGLPARYVSNDAHAFVEIWVPRGGWLRIDLGGAARELNVSNAAKKQVHRPKDDAFPKPPSYSQNYSRLNGAVTGLTMRQRRGPAQGQGHGGRATVHGRNQGGRSQRAVTAHPGAGAAAKGIPLTLLVTSAKTRGLRGEPLTVEGRVLNGDTGQALSGRSVELLLRKQGRDDMVILGEAVSGTDGRFLLKTTIPLITDVGVYRIVAYSAADRTYRAAWSK